MLTMQCAEIIQSVDNTMSRKRTGKINNWPPYSKIFQYIHVKCHKPSKTLDQMYDRRSQRKAKDVCSSLHVSQTLKGTNEDQRNFKFTTDHQGHYIRLIKK